MEFLQYTSIEVYCRNIDIDNCINIYYIMMRRIFINDDITNFYRIGVYCGDPGNVTKATRQSSQFEPTFRLIIIIINN